MTDVSDDFREMTDEDWVRLREAYRPREMLLDVILDLRKRGFTDTQISRDLLFMASQEAKGVIDRDEAGEAHELIGLFRFAAESLSRIAAGSA
jgi:hypothetical protein